MELLWPRFDHSWEARADLIRIYQTVSEEKFCELRPNSVLGSLVWRCLGPAARIAPRSALRRMPRARPRNTIGEVRRRRELGMLRGMATVNYWAADHAAAKQWYADLLGLPPYFERPGYAEFRVGDYQHELV